MSYCTITDVRGLNPKRTYNATSTPTQTQVETYVAQISSELDTILQGRGYSTPITEPTALVTFLQQANAYGAAALAEQAQFPEASGTANTPHGAVLWKQYTEAREWLKNGNLPTTGGAVADLPFSFQEQHMGDSSEPSNTYPWQQPKTGINKDF